MDATIIQTSPTIPQQDMLSDSYLVATRILAASSLILVEIITERRFSMDRKERPQIAIKATASPSRTHSNQVMLSDSYLVAIRKRIASSYQIAFG